LVTGFFPQPDGLVPLFIFCQQWGPIGCMGLQAAYKQDWMIRLRHKGDDERELHPASLAETSYAGRCVPYLDAGPDDQDVKAPIRG
jgi:hypothetical protein